MKPDMTLISIITRHEKLTELRDALYAIDVLGMTVTPVEGCGTQLGYESTYRGVKDIIHVRPKVLVEIVVSTVPVDAVVKAAQSVLQTGKIGDGKIFVSKIDRVVRVRTGEEDLAALTN